MVTTTTSLPPKKRLPIRSIDFGTDEKERTGGVTIHGSSVGARLSTAEQEQIRRQLEQQKQDKAFAEAKRLEEIKQRNEQIAREKAQRESEKKAQLDKLRAMTFKERNELRIAQGVQKLIDQGKKPSKKGLAIHQRVSQKFDLRSEEVREKEGERLQETITVTELPPEKITSPKKPKVLSKVVSYAMGSPNIPILSIAVPGTAGTTKGPTITEFKQIVSTTGDIPGGIVGIVPETRLGLGLTTGFAGVYSGLPTLARIGVSGGIVGLETKNILSSDTTKQEKITSGIIAGLAGTGLAFETFPFARGIIAKFSPKYKGVVTQAEGFKAIEMKDTKIGLIEAGAPAKTGVTADIKLPDISPLKRGGFGVKPSEKGLFIGEGQTLATSQRGLFKKGVDIKLEKEFFTTPQEPFLKIAETRISRLALTDLFKFPKQTEIGFGLPEQAQIGIFKEGAVGFKETPTGFKIGSGTELEAIKTFGTITDVQKLGVTTIKGQAVDLFKFKIGKGDITSIKGVKTPSTTTTARISGEATIGTTLKLSTLTFPTSRLSFVSPPPTTKKTKTIPTLTPTYSKPSETITPTITYPKPKLTKLFYTKKTLRKTPTLTPSYSRSLSYTSSITGPPPPPYKPKFKGKSKRKRRETFGVALRRYGEFKPIGTGLSLQKAMSLGRTSASRTLGATFKVFGGKTPKLRTPLGFRRKPTKQGILFIEKRKHRLSTPSEKREIKIAKRRKRRR